VLTTGMLVAGQGGGRYPAVRWVRGPRTAVGAPARERGTDAVQWLHAADLRGGVCPLRQGQAGGVHEQV